MMVLSWHLALAMVPRVHLTRCTANWPPTRNQFNQLGLGSAYRITTLHTHHRHLLLGRIARTMYVDAGYCYQPSSVICRYVTVVSPAKTAEPIVWVKDPDGPKEPCIRGGSTSPRKRAVLKEKGASHRDTVVICAKRLNQLRCQLGCGLGWAQGMMC